MKVAEKQAGQGQDSGLLKTVKEGLQYATPDRKGILPWCIRGEQEQPQAGVQHRQQSVWLHQGSTITTREVEPRNS